MKNGSKAYQHDFAADKYLMKKGYAMKHTPAWLDNAIFYEIYPQSFFDTNADGIGDLNGIAEKLDYICSLGCNAIWINPCFQSPFFDAGYDISDYYQVAPRYGTNEDLKRLFVLAHEKGIHVLLDLVPGHTSIEHKWFVESSRAKKNEYSDRYIWTDSVWTNPEGVGSIRGFIRGYSERDGVCAANYFSHQPSLNYGFYQPDPAKPWQQPMSADGPRASLEEMKNIMRFWLSMGCDGFRVDMAYSLVKNDPDAIGTISLWKSVRTFLDEEYPDAAMVSEWGNPEQAVAGGFHMDFLLQFGPSHYNDLFRCDHPYFSADGKGNIDAFVANYQDIYKKTYGSGLICIPSGNHDSYRLAKFLDAAQRRLAFAFLLSMPGVPFIYYGDEIGMQYIENLPSLEGGYFRTGSRTPMQWNCSANAGFSAAPKQKLYLPIDPDQNRPTVEAQQSDNTSLWNEIAGLIRFRQKTPALQSRGNIEFLQTGYPLVFRRTEANQKVLVIINPDATAHSVFDICGSIVYTVGSGAEINGNICTIHGQSAVFVCETA